MNIEPTNDDFGDRIGCSLEGARSELERTIKAVCHKAAAKGSLRSGNTVHEVMQKVSDAIEVNVRSTLAELHRISQQTDLDKSELFDITRLALHDHVQRVELSVRGGPIKHFAPEQFLDDSFQKIDDDMEDHLDQFRLGLSEILCNISSTHMKNQIYIGAMSGSTIQQGTSNTVQTNNIHNEIDVSAARDALNAINVNLSVTICDDAQLAKIRADISALKAQLDRPEVSTGVVREIGRSLKKITEGIATNVGSEALTGAALKLWKAIGLS